MISPEYYKVYEQILIGELKSFPVGFFNISKAEDQKNAVELFKYAFKYILKWDWATCEKAIDNDIIKLMKLDKIVKYLDIPTGYEGHISPRYYAHIVYPSKIKFSLEEFDIGIYKDVCNGVSNYPKKFFQDEIGYNRALNCLFYAIKTGKSYRSLEHIYSEFSINGMEILKNNRLLLAANLFETPVDFLHETLADDQKDDFLFFYYKFRYMYKKEKSRKKA